MDHPAFCSNYTRLIDSKLISLTEWMHLYGATGNVYVKLLLRKGEEVTLPCLETITKNGSKQSVHQEEHIIPCLTLLLLLFTHPIITPIYN